MFRSNLVFGTIVLFCTLATGCADRPKEDLASRLAAAEMAARRAPTPDTYVDLSMLYFQGQNYPACVTAAGEAIRLKPDSALAYNNQAACYGSLRKWDEEIAASRQALRISPDFQLARNNQAWAESQKKIAANSGQPQIPSGR
jgi:Tfp pilus assembly protein PilF